MHVFCDPKDHRTGYSTDRWSVEYERWPATQAIHHFTSEFDAESNSITC